MEPQNITPKSGGTFYRPELDLLRLLAFLSVFITHGPRLAVYASPWKDTLARTYNNVANGSVYGLCLFFFLSSYLITELLLREKKKTGTISLKWFYIRRLLRIWPLYYFAIGLAVIAPFFLPLPAMSHQQVAYMAVFLGYFAGMANGNPFNILWSISVEELFYAVWPLLASLGRMRLRLVSLIILPLSLLISSVQVDTWEDPFVQFLFFASGALVSLQLQRSDWNMPAPGRFALATTAFACWVFIPRLSRLGPHFLSSPVSYLLADVGCLLLFLSFYNARVPQGRFVRTLLYFGQISFGLYVFHKLWYLLVEHWLKVGEFETGFFNLASVEILALILTIGMASLSYSLLERPFLRLKDHFALIHTRAVS